MDVLLKTPNSVKKFPLLRPFLLMFLLAALSSALRVTAQTTYQKQFVLNSATSSNTSSVVYSGQYGTNVVVVTSFDIIVFDPNAGTMVSQHSVTSGGSYFRIDAVYRNNNAIFCTATKLGATEVLSYIFKYDLATGTTVWQKRLQTSKGKITVHSITGDRNDNLYLAGSVYDDVLTKNDILIIKTDGEGSVTWSEQIGQDTLDESATSICYKSDREIYFAAVAYSSNNVFGRSLTFRCNNLGTIVSSSGIATVGHGPRMEGSLLGVLNEQLVAIDATIVGPSDPGPVLFRKFDSSLTELSAVCKRGVSPRSVYFNGTHLLLTGQAPVSSGLPGFRTVRFDADLNVKGSRYFNKIPTFSIASSASCFIAESNASYHFIKSGGFDTIQVIRADSNEYVGCTDTSFNLGSSTFAYVDSAYAVVNNPITVSALPDVVTVAKASNIQLRDYCPSTAAITEPVFMNAIQVYPNPASTEINIEYTGISVKSVSIQNLLGSTILTTDHTRNVDISQLASGIYFVKAMIGQQVFTGRFVKR